MSWVDKRLKQETALQIAVTLLWILLITITVTAPSNLHLSDAHHDKAVALVVHFEGFRSEPYQDIGGYWTIGYGSTRGVNSKSDPIDRTEALRRVNRRLYKLNNYLDDVVHVPLRVNQRASLLSLVDNVGVTSFKASKALRLLNRGLTEDFLVEAFDPVKGFVRVDGVIVDGLVNRRASERELFVSR